MLEISLNLERQEIAAACKRFGLVYSEAFYLYCATNRGELLALALFEVGGDYVRVAGYEGEGDYILLDGLLRAGFNYAGIQGLETGWIPEELRYRLRELFQKLNYPASQKFNIVNFFSKYKNCFRPDSQP